MTFVRQDQQIVVASSGRWAVEASPGSALCSWQHSFCRQLWMRNGPMFTPDVRTVPAYAASASGPLARVRAYLGVPLEGQDGQLFGTLCAFSGREQEILSDGLALAQLIARMLSTILAREQFARARSEDAAAAYALVERDALTGLLNRRGWEAQLAREDNRCQRNRAVGSALALAVGDARAGDNSGEDHLTRCTTALKADGRPGDLLARVGGNDFTVLAVECDSAGATALSSRLRARLHAAGVTASVVSATRHPDESLLDTWHRAEQALGRGAPTAASGDLRLLDHAGPWVTT